MSCVRNDRRQVTAARTIAKAAHYPIGLLIHCPTDPPLYCLTAAASPEPCRRSIRAGRRGRVALRLQALKDPFKGQRIFRIAKGSEIAGKSLNPLLVILVLAFVVSQFVEELIQIDARDGTAALAGVVGPAKLDRR